MMNWLSNIRIRYRLWMLTSILTLIMIAISIFGMVANKNTENHMTEMYEDPLSHTRNLGRAMVALQRTGQEALLALQHDPEGRFEHRYGIFHELTFLPVKKKAFDTCIVWP